MGYKQVYSKNWELPRNGCVFRSPETFKVRGICSEVFLYMVTCRRTVNLCLLKKLASLENATLSSTEISLKMMRSCSQVVIGQA